MLETCAETQVGLIQNTCILFDFNEKLNMLTDIKTPQYTKNVIFSAILELFRPYRQTKGRMTERI
jgi:hypothetical protein